MLNNVSNLRIDDLQWSIQLLWPLQILLYWINNIARPKKLKPIPTLRTRIKHLMGITATPFFSFSYTASLGKDDYKDKVYMYQP